MKPGRGGEDRNNREIAHATGLDDQQRGKE